MGARTARPADRLNLSYPVASLRNMTRGERSDGVVSQHISALERWHTERRTALNSLVAAHAAVLAQTRDRSVIDWLDLALFVGLAAEFQGYCRDLHDDAASRIARTGRSVTDLQFQVVRGALVRGRKLDTGNAQPASLGSDFQALGLRIWTKVAAEFPGRAAHWRSTLAELNSARNAIVHSTDELAGLIQEQPLDRNTFERWRGTLDDLANGLDRIVGAYLERLTNAVGEEGFR